MRKTKEREEKEEERKETKRKGIEEEKTKKKPKKEKIIEIKKVAEEWKIWNKEEEIVKSETEAKKLVLERFYKLIYVFSKKTSKRMPTRKLWDYVIDTKKGFIPRKEKVYSLLREEREEVQEFILEQLRKRYIRLLKSPQMAQVFFVEKKVLFGM